MFGQKIIALVSQISEMKLEPMKKVEISRIIFELLWKIKIQNVSIKLATTPGEIIKYFKKQDEVIRELEHAKRLLKNLPVSIVSF